MDSEDQIKLISDRLERFESVVTTKLDMLTDAMVKLARTEEKLVAIENDRTATQQRLNRFSQKLDNIEKAVDENSRVTNTINKVFWLVLAASITTGIGLAFMV